MLVAYNRTQKDMLKLSVNKYNNNNCKAQTNASMAQKLYCTPEYWSISQAFAYFL